MKINRFVALGAIALLVVAAMGAISMRVFAHSSSPAKQAQDCAQENDGAEVESVDDADSGETECGDQNEADAADGETADDETSPAGMPAITAEAAQKTAEEYLNAGPAVKVELDTDDQNGGLIYSVEFSNGTDVTVDAMTGKVLGTEPTED